MNKKITIFVTIIIILCCVNYFHNNNLMDKFHEKPEVEDLSANDYYEESSEVFNKIKAKDSESIQTVDDVNTDLQSRGFAVDICSNYDMDGNYSDENISDDNNPHPYYTAEYMANDVYWTITIMNGQITAYPASYNLEHMGEVPIILSESENIYGYDSETNQYFLAKPSNDTLNVVVVDHITKELLDSYFDTEE